MRVCVPAKTPGAHAHAGVVLLLSLFYFSFFFSAHLDRLTTPPPSQLGRSPVAVAVVTATEKKIIGAGTSGYSPRRRRRAIRSRILVPRPSTGFAVVKSPNGHRRCWFTHCPVGFRRLGAGSWELGPERPSATDSWPRSSLARLIILTRGLGFCLSLGHLGWIQAGLAPVPSGCSPAAVPVLPTQGNRPVRPAATQT